jgi:hypothetical protein
LWEEETGMKRKFLILTSLLAVALWVAPASAFTDTYGSTADFTITAGGQLQIVLTSGRVASHPGDVLTALFFTSNYEFTPVSANITAGSAVIIGTGPGAKPTTLAGTNVGGEWEYLQVATALGNQGISSSGLGFFGNPNFNGPNLQDPVAVDGGQFGIVNGESDPNGGLVKKSEVNKSVTFLLNIPVGEELIITNLHFWYGTGDVPCAPPPTVPVPPTALLLGSGLVGLVALGWRRKKS